MDISMDGNKLVLTPQSAKDAQDLAKWYAELKASGDDAPVSFALVERRRELVISAL